MSGAIGAFLLVLGIGFALWLVYAVTSRAIRPAYGEVRPPRGVHMAAPSLLPAVMALGGSLIGAGLAFRADDQLLANPFLAIPGLLVLVAGIVGWVRASNREWTQVERGSHDEHGTGH